MEGFMAGFTGEEISGLPEVIGEPAIALRRVMETEVSGDTATIHAMYALGTQRKSVLHSMVKEDGVWKISNEEQLSPKILGNTTAVDIHLHGCAFAFDSNAITGGNVAFSVENIGEESSGLVLVMVPEGFDAIMAYEVSEPPPEGVQRIAFVYGLEPGEQINVAFTKPLDPGRYVLICSSHAAEDMASRRTGWGTPIG